MQQLLTDNDRAALPGIYETESLGDAAVVVVRLHAPGTSWEWYLIEAAAVIETAGQVVEVPLREAAERGLRAIGDSDETGLLTDVVLFGLVNGHDVEMGYISLAELLSITRLPVQRDDDWQPRSMTEVRELVAARRRG